MRSTKFNKSKLWFLAVLVTIAILFAAATTLIHDSGAQAESSAIGNLADSDDDEPGADDTRIDAENGLISIRLSESLQAQSGIQTQALVERDYFPEVKAQARVLDIAPLLALRARYQNAKSNAEIAAANLTASKQSFDRLHQLHRSKAISTRRYQQARSHWLSDSAQLNARRINAENIYAEAVQNWGPELTGWALTRDNPSRFEKLLEHKSQLILVTLQPGVNLSADISTIAVSPQANRKKAIAGKLVSKSPKTDGLSQGATYFFTAPVQDIRIGMQLFAWVPTATRAMRAIEIPLSAIIWRNGKPWVYIKTDDDLFTRRIIEQYVELDQSWLVSRGFDAGEEIVISGGQMLLSEEYRWQIPDEDD